MVCNSHFTCKSFLLEKIKHVWVQFWMAIRYWISTGRIRSMPWNDLLPSCSIRTSCTLPSGQEHLHWYPMNGSLIWPTLAWYFRHSISWTLVAPSLMLCFTLMPHFPEPVWHIIQYIVSIFYINTVFLLLYCFKIIDIIAVIEIIGFLYSAFVESVWGRTH